MDYHIYILHKYSYKDLIHRRTKKNLTRSGRIGTTNSIDADWNPALLNGLFSTYILVIKRNDFFIIIR